MVISHGRLVTLLRPSSHSIHPTDLHLLLSTIASSSTFRTPDSEAWIPICLPRFNNKGFLHAYISFVTEGTGVVLVSAERDAFEGVKKWAGEVKTALKKKGTVHRLEMRRGAQSYSLGESERGAISYRQPRRVADPLARRRTRHPRLATLPVQVEVARASDASGLRG